MSNLRAVAAVAAAVSVVLFEGYGQASRPNSRPTHRFAVGGLGQAVTRVRRDSKTICPPPKDYEKLETQTLYANAMEVMTKEIPAYRK